MTDINLTYINLLRKIYFGGELIITRNAETYSRIDLPRTTFERFPLVTWRKTAWRKAIREMEWFMSGNSKCPEELLDWWGKQLNFEGRLLDGYPTQFRYSSYYDNYDNYENWDLKWFDQVKFILEGLRNNPSSRRLILTSWSPGEMANIVSTNNNPNTPTSCHSIVVQFFVRNGRLWLTSYQRSADMLLGVPHNWVQSWAMLLYFAHHTGLEVGGMNWDFGDAHIYREDSHKQTMWELFNVPDPDCSLSDNFKLIYKPAETPELDFNGVPIFKTEDFYIEGTTPEPVVFTKPKLL